MDDFRRITVWHKGKKEVDFENPTTFPLIGLGTQGAVFRLSADRCVKIFARKKDARKEAEALRLAQSSSIIPILYDAGKNYVVMEHVQGSSLADYLLEKGELTESVSEQIVFILHEMKRLKFTRIDTQVRHIIVTSQKPYKVIDHANAYRSKRKVPLRLCKGLYDLGMLETFLNQVKKIDSSLYSKWEQVGFPNHPF